jgi:hypothetical protein
MTDSTTPLNTALLADGSHILQIKSIDNSKRIGITDERLFVVDNGKPLAADPRVIYPQQSASARNGSTVLVTVLVKDNIAGLRADSGVVLRSDSISSSPVTIVMKDDGTGGDRVSGDNIYTATVPVAVARSGPISYTVTATDRLGNATVLTSAIQLDNTPPVTTFTLEPRPGGGVDALHGTTQNDKLVLKGVYADSGGSGLAQVFISVVNDSGMPVNNSPVVVSPSDSIVSRVLLLVPGRNTITMTAIDNAGNRDSTVAVVTYIEPKATMVVDKSGGTVKSPDGASVDVPPQALFNATEITITRVDPIQEPKPLDTNMTLLYVAHEFGPSGVPFRKLVTITLKYTEADLDKNQDGIRDIDPGKLTIVFWDGRTWLKAGKAAVDTVDRTVSVAVNHFTMFDLAVDPGLTPAGLITYWTANPAKNTGATFVYKTPAPGTVSMYILDMAGDVVKTLIPGGTTTAEGSYVWYGEDVAGKFAGVGLYVYVFTYTKDSDKSKTIIRKPVGLINGR